MGARGLSTREKLLSIVDDIEIISKELIESTIAPKAEKLSYRDQGQLVELAMSKNEDLKQTLQLAKHQGEIQNKMIELQSEVSDHDKEIQNLQKQLKEAETLLSTALYQAKQKLEQINRAQANKTNSEEIIRFAHRISSTNAVAAPPNWQPGDPRRPYPTDLEMRMGLLGRINDLPMSQLLDSVVPGGNNSANNNGLGNLFPPWYQQNCASSQISDQGSFSASMFQPSVQVSSTSPGVSSGGFDSSSGTRQQHDDVEVMSTDSSSSSSSDSQ